MSFFLKTPNFPKSETTSIFCCSHPQILDFFLAAYISCQRRSLLYTSKLLLSISAATRSCATAVTLSRTNLFLGLFANGRSRVAVLTVGEGVEWRGILGVAATHHHGWRYLPQPLSTTIHHNHYILTTTNQQNHNHHN